MQAMKAREAGRASCSRHGLPMPGARRAPLRQFFRSDQFWTVITVEVVRGEAGDRPVRSDDAGGAGAGQPHVEHRGLMAVNRHPVGRAVAIEVGSQSLRGRIGTGVQQHGRGEHRQHASNDGESRHLDPEYT